MTWVRTSVVGIALAAASTAAVAFQEQRQAAPVQAAPQASSSVIDPTAASPAARPPQGTEIRIPGLGRLGTLPKLDFGMELLYGTNDQRQPAAVEKGDENEGIAIRGSVKHKF